MTQKELIAKYKEIQENYTPDFSRQSNYIKSTLKHYQCVQDGVARPDNFFDSTVVIFEEVEKPKRKEDYQSDSGSRYWYTNKGVIRGSNHWGCRIVNCDWALKMKDGHTTYGNSCWTSKQFTEEKFGFAKWSDFVLKPQLLEINGQEVLTTLENKIGRDQIKVGNKTYQSKVTVTWEEVK